MGQWVLVLGGVQVLARMRMWIKVGQDFGMIGQKKVEVAQGCPADEFLLLAVVKLLPLLEVLLPAVPLLPEVLLLEVLLWEVPL